MTGSHDDESTSGGTPQTLPAAGVSDQLYAAYLKQRRYLIDAEREAAKSYDRWLLTLSGGALGLSMTFAKDIASPSGVDGLGWLLVAWLALVSAIALGLVCISLSQTAHREFRQYLDDTLEAFAANREDAGFWAKVRKKEAGCRSAQCVGWLNRASGVAFVVGILSLSFFACVNVPKRSSESMAEKPDKSTERVVPAERPAPSPQKRIIANSDRPSEKRKAAMEPAPSPIDQAPAPKPQKPAEEK